MIYAIPFESWPAPQLYVPQLMPQASNSHFGHLSGIRADSHPIPDSKWKPPRLRLWTLRCVTRLCTSTSCVWYNVMSGLLNRLDWDISFLPRSLSALWRDEFIVSGWSREIRIICRSQFSVFNDYMKEIWISYRFSYEVTGSPCRLPRTFYSLFFFFFSFHSFFDSTLLADLCLFLVSE